MFCDHIDGEERELDASLSLSSWCFMLVVWLLLSVPWVCLQFGIVIFPDHTNFLFLGVIHANSDGFGESAQLLGLVCAFVTVQNSYVVAQMAIECQFVRAAKALASLHICTGLP